MMGRPTVLELFAGAGGAALGLYRAGWTSLAHVEWDASACATLRAAIDAGMLDGDVIESDVRTVDWTPYVGRVDVLWGSPPCQPYSSAGLRRGAEDERDMWPATLDAIATIRPGWVVIENVPGAPTDAWCSELAARGYPATARMLDGADYGVPQRRTRMFLVAGPAPYTWPAPSHYGPRLPPLLRGCRAPWKSIGEALPGRRFVGGGTNPRTKDAADQRTVRDITDEPSTTIAGPSGNQLPRVLMEPSPTLCGGSRRSHVNGRSILSANRATRDALTVAGLRSLTVAEAATIQDFPDAYPFQGSAQSRYRQIGNAVPPTLAYVVADALPVGP